MGHLLECTGNHRAGRGGRGGGGRKRGRWGREADMMHKQREMNAFYSEGFQLMTFSTGGSQLIMFSIKPPKGEGRK